jgi:hypothetical protein
MRAEPCCLKLFRDLLIRAVLLLGAANASALTMQPLGYFEANGRLALGSGLVAVSCDAQIIGEAIEEGRIRVDSIRFSGGNPACHRLKADKLPWPGRLLSVDRLQLDGVTVVIKSLLFGGVCGPKSIQATIDAPASALHFPKTPLPPDCRLEGTVKFTPALKVRP